MRGRRKGGKYHPEVAGAKVQSIRASNARNPGEQGGNSKVGAGSDAQCLVGCEQMWGEAVTSKTHESEAVDTENEEGDEDNGAYDSQWGEMVHSATSANIDVVLPDDFKLFRCAAMGNGSHCILESNIGSVNEWEGEPALRRGEAERIWTPEEKGINEWWGDEHRAISTRLAPKLN